LKTHSKSRKRINQNAKRSKIRRFKNLTES
jgi:hypothetical protein